MSGGSGGSGGSRDVLGEAQEHLRVYAKAVADSIWEVQQMRRPDMERVRTLTTPTHSHHSHTASTCAVVRHARLTLHL